VINGVLFEGIDYSGKTSVTKALVGRLAERGIAAERRGCYVSRTPLVHMIDRRALLTDSLRDRDVYYSASMLLDLQLMHRELDPDLFLVQDRHWFSQVGRNDFFHAGDEIVDRQLLIEPHVPFRTQVYLWCDVAAKAERVVSRSPKSPRDALLAGDRSLHQAYDDFTRDLLPSDEQWSVIDTSSRSVDEVVDAVINLLPSTTQPVA
jgi:thymidylate kinase